MARVLVDLERVTMTRPGRDLFRDLSVQITDADRLGIIGLNGYGKSTLLRVITDQVDPESGTVRLGRDVRIAMLDQKAILPRGTVAEVIGDHWEARSIIDKLGMTPWLESSTDELSGGQQKRVALAQTLVTECDLLILDEPTNHLDLAGIQWLTEYLQSFRGGLVLVTHDRHLLDDVTNRILELDRRGSWVHDGGYASALEARSERVERDAEVESRRKNLAAKELEWLRRGAKARTRKPKAHIERARKLIDGKAPAEARADEMDLHFGTPRLGDKVIELEGVGHRYGDGPWLFRGLDLLLDPRERLGLIGLNGAGKTTLLDLMVGRQAPSVGHVVPGPTVRVGYYDQHGVTLDESARVREFICGDREPHWRDGAMLERFWFDRDAQFARVESLSGGERRRLQLVALLRTEPNVLLLDEPTNDLDIDTLRVLEDYLDDWPGALIVSSHDRAFLERTVADVLVLDGVGKIGRRPGGLGGWIDEVLRGGRTGSSASSKTRSKKATNTAPKIDNPSPSTIRHRRKEVDRELTRLGKERIRLNEAVLGTTGHRELADLGREVARVEAALAQAEERWLELSEQLES